MSQADGKVFIYIKVPSLIMRVLLGPADSILLVVWPFSPLDDGCFDSPFFVKSYFQASLLEDFLLLSFEVASNGYRSSIVFMGSFSFLAFLCNGLY